MLPIRWAQVRSLVRELPEGKSLQAKMDLGSGRRDPAGWADTWAGAGARGQVVLMPSGTKEQPGQDSQASGLFRTCAYLAGLIHWRAEGVCVEGNCVD